MMYEKCVTCNKNSHLIFNCKCCQNNYCNRHILPEIHKCTELQKHKDESFNKNKDTILKNAVVPKKIDVI